MLHLCHEQKMCHGFINQHLHSSYSTNRNELNPNPACTYFNQSSIHNFFGPQTQKAHHPHPHFFLFSNCFSNVLDRDSQCGVAGERDEEEEREVCQWAHRGAFPFWRLRLGGHYTPNSFYIHGGAGGANEQSGRERGRGAVLIILPEEKSLNYS